MKKRVIHNFISEFAEQIAAQHNDNIQWMTWVLKKKRLKIQDRLLVVGEYRIYSLKFSKFSKSVQRQGHLFDLRSIIVDDAVERLVLKWPSFHIECMALDIPSTVKIIRTQINRISHHFPSTARAVISGPATSMPEGELAEEGPAAGLVSVYKGWCAFHLLPESNDFMTFIADSSSGGKTVLDLSSCPGIEAKTEFSFSLTPALAALRYNPYFTAFELRGVAGRKEAVEGFADPLAHNKTLTRVVLRNLDAPPEGFVLIGESIKTNTMNKLLELDFSANKMGDKGVAGLAAGLTSLQHGLTKLYLADNAIGSKGIAALCQALRDNAFLSSALEELDLSKNHCGTAGTKALADWLIELKEGKGNLARLYLSDMDLGVAPIVTSLRLGPMGTLSHLDLSFNKMDKNGTQALSLFLSQSKCLDYLNLSYTKLDPDGIEALMVSAFNNAHLPKVTPNVQRYEDGHAVGLKFDFSGNDLTAVGAENVARAFMGIKANENNLHTLILRDNKLKATGVQKIVDGLVQHSSVLPLGCLDLSFNLASSKKPLKPLTESLCQLLSSTPSLQTLLIAGDGKHFFYGSQLAKIFEALVENRTLTELDISGNKIGSKDMLAVCEQLRNNRSLTYLNLDNNGSNIGVLQALKGCLSTSNQTLFDIPNPAIDIEKMIASSKDGAKLKPRLQELMTEISVALNSHRSAALPASNIIGRRNTDRIGGDDRSRAFSEGARPVSPRGGGYDSSQDGYSPNVSTMRRLSSSGEHATVSYDEESEEGNAAPTLTKSYSASNVRRQAISKPPPVAMHSGASTMKPPPRTLSPAPSPRAPPPIPPATSPRAPPPLPSTPPPQTTQYQEMESCLPPPPPPQRDAEHEYEEGY
ncbi:hypothetical protein QOT17_006951 [Balamuthia mandrillaris]